MTPQIVVRVAVAGDKTTIARHQELAIEESAQYRGRPSPQGNSSLAYVAIVGESIFGSLSVLTEEDGNAIITHVFVEAEAREIGIGDSLLSFAMHDLRSRNIRYLAASAQPGDRSLKNLFERHGLVAQTILVGRSLSDPSIEEHVSQ